MPACQAVAEQLLDMDFGLAFRTMHDLRLPFEKVNGRPDIIGIPSAPT